MRLVKSVFIILLLFLSTSLMSQQITPIWHGGGWISCMDMTEELIFLGHNSAITIHRNLGNEQTQIKSLILDYTPDLLRIFGDTLYAAYSNTVCIYNVTDPEKAGLVRTFSFGTTDDKINDILVSGSRIYLAINNTRDKKGALRIIDLSNPNSPKHGSIETRALSVAVKGSTAFVITDPYDAELFTYLRSIDISDLDSIIELDKIKVSGADRLSLDGNYAFTGGSGQSGLNIIDISNPSQLKQRATDVGNETILYTKAKGNIAWAATWTDLAIYDISDIANPTPLSTLDLGYSSINDLFILNDGQTIAIFQGGEIKRIDCSDPANPVLLPAANYPQQITHIELYDDYLYMVHDRGVHRYNTNNNMQQTEWLQDSGDKIFFHGSLCFLTTIADNNSLAKSNPVPEKYKDYEPLQTQANNGVNIYDLSNPDDPFLISTSTTPFAIKTAAIADSTLYLMAQSISSNNHLIQVVSIRTPSQPEKITDIVLPGAGIDLQISANPTPMLYAAWYHPDSKEGGISIYDLTTAAAPELKSGIDLPGKPSALWVQSPLLLVSAMTEDETGWHLQAWDVSDAESPLLMATRSELEQNTTVWDITATGGVVYAASRNTGLHSYLLQPQTYSSGTLKKAGPGWGFAPLARHADSRYMIQLLSKSMHGDNFIFGLMGYGNYGKTPLKGFEGLKKLWQPQPQPPLNQFFVELNLTTVPANLDGTGCSVTPAPGQHRYLRNSTIELQATDNPENGWIFYHWWGAVESESPSALLFMDEDKEVEAEFKPIELTVSGKVDSTLMCPDDLRRNNYLMLPISFCASEVDDWEVTKINLRGSGTGNEKEDIANVRIMGGESELFSGTFPADDGLLEAELSTPIPVPAGDCNTVFLYYSFGYDPETYAMDEGKSFAVETSGVVANPLHYETGLITGNAHKDTLMIAKVFNTRFNGFPTIQQAVDSPLTLYNDTCWVCSGTFKENVKVTKRLHIKSMDPYNPATLEALDAADHAIHFSWTRSSLRYMTVTGASSEGAAGVYIDSTADWSYIGNSTIENCNNGIILALGAKNISVIGNSINRNRRHGILVQGKGVTMGSIDYRSLETRHQINNNYINENGGHGIYLVQAGANRLEDNTIQKNDGHGIYVDGGGTQKDATTGNNSLLENTCLENQDGIHITLSGKNSIHRNSCMRNAKNGLYWDAGALRSAQNNRIYRNTLSYNTEHGLYINRANDVSYDDERTVINHNSANHNQKDGIHFEKTSGTLEILENYTNQNQGYGIYMKNSEYTLFQGNTLNENKCGLYLPGCKRLKIFGNTMEENREYGLYIDDGLFNKITKQNRANSNGLSGIYLKNDRDVEIDSLTANHNNSAGVYLQECLSPLLTDSHFEENKNCGLIFENNKDGFFVKNCTISTNEPYGVFIYGGQVGLYDEGWIHESVIRGSRQSGIYAENAYGLNFSRNEILINLDNGIWLKDCFQSNIEHNVFRRNQGAGVLMERVKARPVLTWVTNNRFIRNCKGIHAIDSDTLGVTGNEFDQNSCSTGLHLLNTNATVQGNQFSDDLGGDAIKFVGSSHGTVYNNNIFGNAGYGLNNLNSTERIWAQNNWWGAPSGPGAGSADGINGNVDVSNPLGKPLGLLLSLPADTIRLVHSRPDSIVCSLQNWKHRDDMIDLSVTATQSDWLAEDTLYHLSLKDSLGALISIPLLPPSGTNNGALNQVVLKAVSKTDPGQTATDSVIARLVYSDLQAIEISPQEMVLQTGETVQFSAKTLDSSGVDLKLPLIWYAAGGTIDENGLYTAGTDSGLFYITAQDAESGLHATVKVRIGNPTGVESIALPTQFKCHQNYPNPFNPATTIRFETPFPGSVELSVYNIQGRRVKTLIYNNLSPGYHQAIWNGMDEKGSPVAGGIYIYRIIFDNPVNGKRMSRVRKMTLIK